MKVQCTEFVAATAAGTTGYGTQICMTVALKYCKAAPAIAMSYLSIVWGLLGGYFFFKEVSHCLGMQETTFEGSIGPPPGAWTCSTSHELLQMSVSCSASCQSASNAVRLWRPWKQGLSSNVV